MILSFLIQNPLLLLFIVAGIGYPIGRIKIGGIRLGVAAVLFVGLGIGAFHPDLVIPEIIYVFGLILFIYTIGLSSGAVFFESMRKQGVKANGLVLIGVIIAALISMVSILIFNFTPAVAGGIFTGGTTNTPALAAVIDTIKTTAPVALVNGYEIDAVVAFSLTYPMGVLGMILVIIIFQRIWKIKPSSDAGHHLLKTITVRVTWSEAVFVKTLMDKYKWDVVFARFKRGKQPISLVDGNTQLQAGDLVSLVGTQETLETVVPYLGVEEAERLDFDVSAYDKRRIFISNQEVSGQKLSNLRLNTKFNALVTRVRRGDIEFVPHGNTVLIPGDQLRLVAPHDKMEAVAKYLGDSYRSASEVDVLTFGFGVALGLLLGALPIPLPGGMVLKLGVAGGPLLVSIFLGAIKRTGPIVWDLPYGANLTLRQIGLVVFLAGIGTKAGYRFVNMLIQGEGWVILLAGLILTAVMTAVTLWIGNKWLKLSFAFLCGLLSGLQTQPAVLAFSNEQFGDELPSLGYATVFPVAMILKIITAQILLLILLS